MGLRYAPFAFSEQGVAMLSSVLKSKKAIDVNIAIMRSFVMLRQHLADYGNLKELIDFFGLLGQERKLTLHIGFRHTKFTRSHLGKMNEILHRLALYRFEEAYFIL